MKRNTMKRRFFGLALALLLTWGGVAAADSPAAESPALAKLQQMVENLGYSVTPSSDNQSFSIQWQAHYNYTLNFEVSKDSTLAYAYVKLGTLDEAHLAKLNYAGLLEASDTGDYYFSMEKRADGKSESLFANTILPLSNLTPEQLRGLLQAMANKLDGSAALWDSSLWK
ncbi:type III secretion system chaperone [Acidocella sp.]|uniref:type III secretion system chaperone n=1 Tax=Acidocella sp. TaxID=50710 RepID=UPI0026224387|nr:type III secretion system chaperone [Acidocella sp.]